MLDLDEDDFVDFEDSTADWEDGEEFPDQHDAQDPHDIEYDH